jgi:hypothetical protein
MKDKALEALRELKEETSKISDNYTVSDWRDKTINLIIRLYGKDSAPLIQIARLKYSSDINGDDNIIRIKEQARVLIDGFIREIERFGPPEKAHKEEKELHINITQSQIQETKVNVNVFTKAIQEELTGKQLGELQGIIDDKALEPEGKKSKIIDKLKQFGSDVATNVLANILTNPSLFG